MADENSFIKISAPFLREHRRPHNRTTGKGTVEHVSLFTHIHAKDHFPWGSNTCPSRVKESENTCELGEPLPVSRFWD